MTEEQKLLIKTIVKELKGKISYHTCVDRNKEHKRIIIDYGESTKTI